MEYTCTFEYCDEFPRKRKFILVKSAISEDDAENQITNEAWGAEGIHCNLYKKGRKPKYKI